jgi:hypothetical protein
VRRPPARRRAIGSQTPIQAHSQSGERFEQFDQAPEQLSTNRERLGHRLVDVAQQLSGAIEQSFAGDGELDAVR